MTDTDKRDLHAEIASKIFRVPVEEVTEEQRLLSREVSFGLLYGGKGPIPSLKPFVKPRRT
jgi:DNA polymerase I-like protein with 3'-5' exonuclease and polymerase domains